MRAKCNQRASAEVKAPLVLVAESVPPRDLHVQLLPQDVDVVGQAQAQQLAPLGPRSLNTLGQLLSTGLPVSHGTTG